MLADYAPYAYRETYAENDKLPSLRQMAKNRDSYVDKRTTNPAPPQPPELSDDEVAELIGTHRRLPRD